MFRGPNIYVTTPPVNVTIERVGAPEAAKLYGELKDKATKDAKAEVTAAMVHKFGVNNELRALELPVENRVDIDQMRTRFLFEINGERYDIRIDVDSESLEDSFALSIAQDLVTRLAHSIKQRWKR